MRSGLIDLRECSEEKYTSIYQCILNMELQKQPRWFRPFLLRSRLLRQYVGYGHWSRAWEYPWAIEASCLDNKTLKVLDAGGGGTSFIDYIAGMGNECFVIDPSLDHDQSFDWNSEKGVHRNIRSVLFSFILRALQIRRAWTLPNNNRNGRVKYFPYSAQDTKFPDEYFDRIFCLSVMEHIPEEIWPACIKEFERILKPGGRLILTLDMSSADANNRKYMKLLDNCNLKLIGNPSYKIPITAEDKQQRHPGQTYETIGLLWQKDDLKT